MNGCLNPRARTEIAHPEMAFGIERLEDCEMINVWRAIALECLYREWKKSNWPAARGRFARDITMHDLMWLWGIRATRLNPPRVKL